MKTEKEIRKQLKKVQKRYKRCQYPDLFNQLIREINFLKWVLED